MMFGVLLPSEQVGILLGGIRGSRFDPCIFSGVITGSLTICRTFLSFLWNFDFSKQGLFIVVALHTEDVLGQLAAKSMSVVRSSRKVSKAYA